MPNCKAPGHDGVQGFWIKRLNKMHARIATQLNEILEGTKWIPWNTILDNVRKNSAMSKGCSKGEICEELQTNNLSSTYVEITYKYYFREYVLFHGEQKLTSRGAKGLKEGK